MEPSLVGLHKTITGILQFVVLRAKLLRPKPHQRLGLLDPPNIFQGNGTFEEWLFLYGKASAENMDLSPFSRRKRNCPLCVVYRGSGLRY